MIIEIEKNVNVKYHIMSSMMKNVNQIPVILLYALETLFAMLSPIKFIVDLIGLYGLILTVLLILNQFNQLNAIVINKQIG